MSAKDDPRGERTRTRDSATPARRQPDEAVRESETRYRTLFANMTEGFALGEAIFSDAGLPRDFRLLEMNDAFERQSGLKREEIVGRPMSEVLPHLEQSWIDTYCAVAQGAPARRFEDYNRDLDRHFSVYCFSPRAGQFAVLFTDVTENKRTEERLKEADQRKDEFLATLAHELRNPLAAIRYALRLLEGPMTDPAAAAHGREVIERQVKLLVRLVDELLDVSRITRNEVRLRKEPVRLSALVHAAIESTEPHTRAARHHLSVDLGEADPVIDGDPARLVQAFANLLSNAVKFTPPGGRIEVSAGVEGGEAVVRVRDSGIGIASEVLPHIFEMFHQGEGGLERAAGGLGIGLTIAQRLVEMHGGRVAASSAGPNLGAELEVRLPTVPARLPSAEPTTTEPAGPPSSAGAKRLDVLVVDDNVDSAEMLSMLVSLHGHDARVVHDGPKAIAAATESRPDVVLLDIGLPGMNGYDVAREIRRLHGNASHLVAITGWGQEEDRRRAREAGFDCHVTKPADPAVVTRLLASIASGDSCDNTCDKCLQTPLTRSGDFGVAGAGGLEKDEGTETPRRGGG